ncbi:Cas10/Cmr2 second palm domain-containing protein [Aphanothece minutissima]|uniref:Cas10/Cmr2 second palm domain-containing protein n=1 Tax=Aphanothece minutissima TaxID=543815 RepID=UPI0015E64499|nr:type III-B CRISPR-associated protein Cas10/Cmr2 [Aphanothece minutissima]
MTTIFTVVTFAPVQSFISASRKLRDLYGSSLLLSFLAKTIADDVGTWKNADGRNLFAVVSPASIDSARGVPNILVIAGDYSLAQGKAALDRAWAHVLSKCKHWLEGKLPKQPEPFWDRSWHAWQTHAWEFFHAQGATIQEARAGLAMRKQQRDWRALNWVGESSTLSGTDAICWPGMDAPRPHGPWSREADEGCRTFMKSLNQEDVLGEVFSGESRLGDAEEQISIPELVKRLVTYREVARQVLLPPVRPEDQASASPADPLYQRALEVLLPSHFRAVANSPLKCWFVADGDSIGEHLEALRVRSDALAGNACTGRTEAEVLAEFSGNMRDWAAGLYSRVPSEMSRKATVVYAGGDDLLGALHAAPRNERAGEDRALSSHDLFHWLESVFPSLWEANAEVGGRRHSKSGQPLSISMGLVVAQRRVPQREALQHAREAESSAKDGGRNRFGLRVLFANGQHLEWICPWWLMAKHSPDDPQRPGQNLRMHYCDREGRKHQRPSSHASHPIQPSPAPKWRHLAEDVQYLVNRSALQGRSRGLELADQARSEAIATALWKVYFPDLEAPRTERTGNPLMDAHSLCMPLAPWLVRLARVMATLEQPSFWKAEDL